MLQAYFLSSRKIPLAVAPLFDVSSKLRLLSYLSRWYLRAVVLASAGVVFSVRNGKTSIDLSSLLSFSSSRVVAQLLKTEAALLFDATAICVI